MKTKDVEKVVAPQRPHYVGDGFRVHNFIPGIQGMDMHRMDPFIMLDYNSKFHFPPSAKPKGVGVHPHRGFETVTIAYRGRIEHGDSSGGGGVIGEGDVQWMTAGAGILHKEFHETAFSKEGGEFQMVQLWVNLPAKDKMTTPKYQGLSKDNIPSYELENGMGNVNVIAGEYKGVKGGASTFSPLHMYNLKLKAGGKAALSFPAHYNSLLLVIEGRIKVNDEDVVSTDHLALFKNEGEQFSILAEEDAIVLVLGGEPLNESIAAHGPFVMNTRQEIMQAMEDYNLGKFGYLEN